MLTSDAVSVPALEIRRSFRVSREKVFAAWTQKSRLEQWMCRDSPTQFPNYTILDVRPGGSYQIEIKVQDGAMYVCNGVFKEVKPPERLVFTWSWVRIPPKEGESLQRAESLITLELREKDLETEMIFTHEMLESARVRDDHQKGWEGCFHELTSVLEKHL